MKAAGLLAMAMIAAGTSAAAQVRFETGGGASHLDQMASSPLTSVAGGVAGYIRNTRFQLDGNSDDHVGVGVSGSVSGLLHAQFNPGAWHVEVGPSARGGRDIGAAWARSMSGDIAAERSLGPVTVRGGWQFGVATTGGGHSSFYRPDFSADIRLGNFTFSPTWQSVVIHDSILAVRFVSDTMNSERDTSYRARTRDVRDVGFGLKWATGALSMSGHVTRRFGAGIVAQTWWEGSAALRLTPFASLVTKSGRIASEPVLGLRGGKYTTVGLRVDMLPHVAPHPAAERANRAVVERIGHEGVRLRFTLPASVRHATLASDLTDWKPIALSRTDDGRWEVVLSAKSGIHRVNISADDGPWLAPPGLPAADDGFGANVGLLVVED